MKKRKPKEESQDSPWHRMLERDSAEMMADPGLTHEEKAEFLRQLELPDEEWQPVKIEGEPLSETIIRLRGERWVFWYCDASALAKRYIRETGSPWFRREVGKHSVVIAQISIVEVRSALTLRLRTGSLSRFAAHKARQQFANQRRGGSDDMYTNDGCIHR